MPTTKMNIAGQTFLINKSQGVWPRFTLEIRHRVKKKLACNMVVVGEARIGKSYMAIQIARNLYPDFDPDKDVVYTYKEYMTVLLKGAQGEPIVFDEPSYAMGKRQWFKEVNQALTMTIESQGFMIRPLLIPVINLNLLDKVIRTHLIQYMVECYDRGKAIVKRFKPSQQEDKLYFYRIARLKYGMMDNDKCSLDSCLGPAGAKTPCPKMGECPLMRARYERRKRSMQLGRYNKDLEDAKEQETKQYSSDEIIKKAYEFRQYFTDAKGLVDPKKLRVVLREKADISIGQTRSYDIRIALVLRYPSDFKET